MLSVFTVKNIRNKSLGSKYNQKKHSRVTQQGKSFTSAEECTTNKKCGKQAHPLGSPFVFYPDTTFPLMRIGHIWVHNSSQLAIVLGSGGINIYNERK
jgi:hypothetical protein